MSIGTLTKIVSGAQTGADRGALDAALAAGLQIGGWAPKGWRAEDGSIPLVFRQYMKQSISPEYTLRTRLNVQDSDATLLLSFSKRLTGGTKLTLEHVKAQKKPCKHLVLPRGRGVVPAEVTSAVWEWLQVMRVNVLNVAGPRESKEPGIQAATKRVIAGLLNAKRDADTAAALALQDAEADATMATESAQAAEERAESLRRMIDMGLQMRPMDDEIAKADRGKWERVWIDEPRDTLVGSFTVNGPYPSIPTPQESLPVEDDDLEFFIASCAAATTAEDFTRKNIGLIDCYYGMDGNSVGGSLHIVLDDGNHERDSVQFCLNWAIREGDKAGEALARALLALPDDVYVQVLPPMEDPCEGCGGVEGLHAAGCKGSADV